MHLNVFRKSRPGVKEWRYHVEEKNGIGITGRRLFFSTCRDIGVEVFRSH